ncbi:MAG: TIGR00282 family metallophosphoesterase [Acetobacter sp.]|nr:TIGR00282 family metallophosphoesterase [Acetobacter sp.]
MRFLFLGDIVGRAGRDAVIKSIPNLRRALSLDLIIANAENASHGFGLSPAVATSLLECGLDVLTLGNHAWDQRALISHINTEPRIIRPLNYPPGTPGQGFVLITLTDGRKVLVVNIMGRLFMDPLDDPFRSINELLTKHRLGTTVQAIIVDIHAEATSEKWALGHMLDGRISLAVGTHTHAPTADYRILAKGTAFQTDVGMCGDYDSVIGMGKETAITRFTRKIPTERLHPAEGEATICGLLVETHTNGLAHRIAPLRLGGILDPSMPNF